jgi:hypothetical protein
LASTRAARRRSSLCVGGTARPWEAVTDKGGAFWQAAWTAFDYVAEEYVTLSHQP